MRKLFPLLLFLVSCSGVQHTTSRKVTPEVYDVGWTVLVRDFDTARSYTRQRVRIRLDKQDYRVEGDEIHVFAADNGAPPILICRGVNFHPQRPFPPITVTGTCYGAQRDGIWRNRNADYCVILDDCRVAVR